MMCKMQIFYNKNEKYKATVVFKTMDDLCNDQISYIVPDPDLKLEKQNSLKSMAESFYSRYDNPGKVSKDDKADKPLSLSSPNGGPNGPAGPINPWLVFWCPSKSGSFMRLEDAKTAYLLKKNKSIADLAKSDSTQSPNVIVSSTNTISDAKVKIEVEPSKKKTIRKVFDKKTGIEYIELFCKYIDLVLGKNLQDIVITNISPPDVKQLSLASTITDALSSSISKDFKIKENATVWNSRTLSQKLFYILKANTKISIALQVIKPKEENLSTHDYISKFISGPLKPLISLIDFHDRPTRPASASATRPASASATTSASATASATASASATATTMHLQEFRFRKHHLASCDTDVTVDIPSLLLAVV